MAAYLMLLNWDGSRESGLEDEYRKIVGGLN